VDKNKDGNFTSDNTYQGDDMYDENGSPLFVWPQFRLSKKPKKNDTDTDLRAE